MPDQPRIRRSACACLALSLAACAVDHSGPEDPDAGAVTGITIVIERIDASIEVVTSPDTDDADASTGQALAVITTAPAACPALTLSIVGPHQVNEGDTVAYEAHVMGSSESALEYGWSASNGDLSTTDSIRTEYTCTHSGAAAITLRASEAGMSERCGTAMALALWCAPLPD